jgi:hypothetical protein
MYCPECCHEIDKIEGEQPNCHFTINEGDTGDAAPSKNKINHNYTHIKKFKKHH